MHAAKLAEVAAEDDPIDRVVRMCRGLGRAVTAELEACAPTMRGMQTHDARSALLACIKIASPVRPACSDLSAFWRAAHLIAGIDIRDCGGIQVAVESDGGGIQYNVRLAAVRSLWIVTGVCSTGPLADGDDQLVLDAAARFVARFAPVLELEEFVVVLSARRKSAADDNTPYSVAERLRASIGVGAAAAVVTSSSARASFNVQCGPGQPGLTGQLGSRTLRVVVVREFPQTAPGADPEGSLARANAALRGVYDEGADARSRMWAVLVIAPMSYYTLGLVAAANMIFSVSLGAGASGASGASGSPASLASTSTNAGADSPPDMRPSYAGGARLCEVRAPCGDVGAALERRGGSWVDFAPADTRRVTTPEAMLSDPTVRVAVMEEAWRLVSVVYMPGSPSDCLLAVQRCASSAAACLGVDVCVALVRSVLGSIRTRSTCIGLGFGPGFGFGFCLGLDENWHPDLDDAAARLAVALAHNVLLHIGDVHDVRRAQPALAVLLTHEPREAIAPAAMMRAAFSALVGVHAHPSAQRGLADIFSQIEPPPACLSELLCAACSLFRARLQCIRDAESRLGCGPVLRVAVETVVRECTGGSFVYATGSVT